MRPTGCCFLVLLCACGSKTPPPVDAAAAAQKTNDSVLAAHTRDASALSEEAWRTMAQLLTRPVTATFDSLIVAQPAMSGGAWPAPAVCGRIGGRPGIKGSTRMTPFVYRNRMTVFVLDQSNAAPFAKLRTQYCTGPGVAVLLKSH